MEDYVKQLLMQELQGGDSGEDSNPTITPESKAGVGIASLINAIVGAKAMKGSGNAGLGALYGGALTYGEGMGNLQKAAAQAQANRSKEERIKSLIKNQIFKQNFDTVKYLEDRKAKEAEAERKDRAAQNYGDLLTTPKEETDTIAQRLSDIARDDPGLAQKHLQNTKETREDLSINRIIKDSMEVDSQTGKPTPRAVDARRVLGGIEQHKRRTEKPEKFDDKISIAARAAGVDPRRVVSGSYTQKEAIKIADEYKKRFGIQSLYEALGLSGKDVTPNPSQPTQPTKTLKYDSKGNLIK